MIDSDSALYQDSIAALDRALAWAAGAVSSLDRAQIDLARAPVRMRWESRTGRMCREEILQLRTLLLQLRDAAESARRDLLGLRAEFRHRLGLL